MVGFYYFNMAVFYAVAWLGAFTSKNMVATERDAFSFAAALVISAGWAIAAELSQLKRSKP